MSTKQLESFVFNSGSIFAGVSSLIAKNWTRKVIIENCSNPSVICNIDSAPNAVQAFVAMNILSMVFNIYIKPIYSVLFSCALTVLGGAALEAYEAMQRSSAINTRDIVYETGGALAGMIISYGILKASEAITNMRNAN